MFLFLSVMKTVGWVVLHGCVAHVDVHGEVATEHGMQMWSVLYAEAVEHMSSSEAVWHVRV